MLKSDFPIFKKYPELVYLDNAATTQKPDSVIEAIKDFYSYENANIHRGVYDLSNNATTRFEAARKTIATFLDVTDPECIAFTSGTTEATNIIAQSFLKKQLKAGQNIVTTVMEHHANFVVWQQLALEQNIELRVIPILDSGDLNYDEMEKLIDNQTALVAISHISNTLGTVNDIKRIIDVAHRNDAPILIDAAQSATFYNISKSELDYDFLTFSGHKLFGAFGIGILYADPKHHSSITPYNFGGGIIQEVTVESTQFQHYPHNLDAGTPNVAGVLGLDAAIHYLNSLDRRKEKERLEQLTKLLVKELLAIDEVTIIGSPVERSAIVSFMVDDIHPHDAASFLNKDNIAVRAGLHCTQPLLHAMNVPATVRVSLTGYNNSDDIQKLINSLKALISFWK